MGGQVHVIPGDGALKIEAGAKVIGARNGQAAGIASVPTGGSATAADNAAAVNSILAVMRDLGMIASAPG